MPMYKWSEHNNNYFKSLGSLYQYCRDEPILDNLLMIIPLIHSN